MNVTTLQFSLFACNGPYTRILCRSRAAFLSSTARRGSNPAPAQKPPPPSPKPPRKSAITSIQNEAVAEQLKQDKKDEAFVPRPLARLLGVDNPPKSGENTGLDTRTWRQKRDDLVDYDRHLRRRKELTREFIKPYFREWKNMRVAEGKTFIAANRLFRADKALYFPNLQGVTLAASPKPQDTTPVLRHKLSVLRMFSSRWAELQTKSFGSGKQNPELMDVLKEGAPLGAQIVDINVEQNWLRALLVRLFMPGLRRSIPKERHDKYFLVKRGLTEQLKQAIGLANSKVGYVYLIDGECRIRWAGSGNAEKEEKDALVHGLRRLIGEKKKTIETPKQGRSKTVDKTKATATS